MSEQKIEQFWRDATAEDVARVMKGEKVVARFRDYDHADWTEFDLLGGFATSVNYPVSWFDVCGVRWFQCQVYDPPEWFKNKPDPGEGYRLLEKFPDEPKLSTDEFWNLRDKTWRRTATTDETQSDCAWYRRRIEPVNSDPGGDWEPTDDEIQYAMDRCGVPTIKICDVAKIAGHSPVATNNEFRKFVDKVQAGEVSYTCSFVWEGQLGLFKVKVGDRIQHPNGCCIDITETGFKVNATLDTVEFGK